MRYRSTIGSSCPSISSREYAWDKTVQPYRKQYVNYHPYDTQPAYQVWTVPNGYKSLKEEIWDQVGEDGAFRPCTHTIETNEFYGDHIEHRYYYGWGGNAYLQCISKPDVDAAMAQRLVPNVDMNAMADEALAFMLPRLNEGTSLINSLIELKDIKSMNPIPSLKRLQGRRLTLKKLAASKEERSAYVREIATRMNNAHLNATYGIVPFLMDIVSIHDELVALAMKLEQLKRYAGTRQQRHYKRVIPQSDGVRPTREWKQIQTNAPGWVHPVRADFFGGGFRQNPTLVKRTRWTLRPTYHATVRYSYTLPQMDSEHEYVYALLDTLGVRLDPTIIWNAVRYSFVVDWIVDVSSFLQRFARDNYPINTTITEFCHSLAYRKEGRLDIVYPDDPHPTIANHPENFGPFNNRGVTPVYYGSYSYYNRSLAKPDVSSVRMRALKLRQAAIAGSLLLARTRTFNTNRYQRDAVIPSNMTGPTHRDIRDALRRVKK